MLRAAPETAVIALHVTNAIDRMTRREWRSASRATGRPSSVYDTAKPGPSRNPISASDDPNSALMSSTRIESTQRSR